tara:strand:- start:846 stop:1049 length:204 start_codon:yes stop_codon:yes gene_type:complete
METKVIRSRWGWLETPNYHINQMSSKGGNYYFIKERNKKMEEKLSLKFKSEKEALNYALKLEQKLIK